MFNEEDDTTINNEDRKCYILLNFVTFKELQEKSSFLRIAAQTFGLRFS